MFCSTCKWATSCSHICKRLERHLASAGMPERLSFQGPVQKPMTLRDIIEDDPEEDNIPVKTCRRCGAPIRRHYRLCAACRRNARRKTWRHEKRRQRQGMSYS